MQPLEHLRALLSYPSYPDSTPAQLWLALQALQHPTLAPYIADPLLPYQGEFLSLDSQRRALQRLVETPAFGDDTTAQVGMLWGVLYRPAQERATVCRIAAAGLPLSEGQHWFSLEPVLPISDDVERSASLALTEALRLIEQAGLPPPSPTRLVFSVEEAESAVGDSLGLPLFLAILSALTRLPLKPGWGATGGLGEGVVRPVGWLPAKAAALEEQGRALLTPERVARLAEAAAKLLVDGECLTPKAQAIICPLVSEPTFLVADTELFGLQETRSGIVAFEQTVCATVERYGGFLYRRQAGVEEGIRAAFASPEVACQAAIALQQALLWRPWPEGVAPLLARIGLCQGAAERVSQGYFGQAPGQAVRLMQAAHAGQILLPQELVAHAPFPPIALGKHRLRDLSMTLAIYRLDAPQVPVCSLPPRTLRVRNHNLPQEPNPLLGREAELAAIRGFVENGRRLVTLIGPGGIGKTRLALQVAAELAEHFADGVWFVSLADVQTEEQLVVAIAEAMGLDSRDSRVNFVEALAERQALLVLDNCETILPLAARIAQLLRQAPRITCLATSQALLSLSGEWRFEVPSLVQDEAERLFIERILQADPGLTLSESDMGHVQRICQRLEGIPLAVELAAARRRLFSLEEIEVRLDDALSLLVTRARDVPERQRTLRGALEWSFSLLDTAEQEYFLRLSVLPGSFNREAACALCNEPEAGEWLLALEEKSLLRRESDERWRILSIVRLFAQELLQKDSSLLDTTHEGLIRYISDKARTAARHVDTLKERESFQSLDADIEIIRVAMEISLLKFPLLFVECFIDLNYFLRRRRYLDELEKWCKEALILINKNNEELEMKLILIKAYLYREKYSDEESYGLFNEAKLLAGKTKDDYCYAEAISGQGIILVRQGSYDNALVLYDKAGKIYKKCNDEVRYVRNLNNRAQAKIRLGKFSEAETDLKLAEKIGERIQCTRDYGTTMNNFGFLYNLISDAENEKKYIEKSMKIYLENNENIPFLMSIMNYMIAIDKKKFLRIDIFIILEILFFKYGAIKQYYNAKKHVEFVRERSCDVCLDDIYSQYRNYDFETLEQVNCKLFDLARI